jgi:hypothetical protein
MFDSATPALESEPDHRAAEPDGEGEESPVVAALLIASAVSGMLSKTAETKPSPNAVCHEARRQSLHRHHRRAKHQREQEDRALERSGQHAPVGLAQRHAEQQHDPIPRRR